MIQRRRGGTIDGKEVVHRRMMGGARARKALEKWVGKVVHFTV